MEKNMEITKNGSRGTTLRIDSFIPSYPKESEPFAYIRSPR